MPSKIFRRALTTAVCAFALSAGAYGPASAAAINFTWNPSVTGLTTAGPFTADNFNIQDWASINVPTNPSIPGSVTETGYLELLSFTDAGGSTVSSVHQTGHSNDYGMYEKFTATSDLSPCTIGTSSGLCGSFQTIHADVYLYSTAHGLASYSFSGGLPQQNLHGNSQVLIASEN